MKHKRHTFLVVLLALALSPLSACAQIVCNVTCAFQEGHAPHSGMNAAPGSNGSLDGDKSTGMHCHGERDVAARDARVSANPNRECQPDSCVSSEGGATPAVSERDALHAPSANIESQVLARASASLVSLPSHPTAQNVCDVLSASGTLRL